MESSENVYYTESSEIIDEGSTWGMEDVVIVENENLAWQEEGSEITVNYEDACENPDATLTENDIYLSANAEESTEADKTAYYSILETTYQNYDEYDDNNISANIVVNVDEQNHMILPDDVQNNTEDIEIQKDSEENIENQVILYSTDDPNEMYAVQIADDGNGNFQKYKYKVRPTADGQLEAIPGTIELQDESVDDLIQSTLDTSNKLCNQENIECDTDQDNGSTECDLAVKSEIINDDSMDNLSDEEEYGTPEYLLSENEMENDKYIVEAADSNDFALQIQNNYLEVTPDIEEENISVHLNEKVEKTVEKKRKFFKSRESNITQQQIPKNILDNESVFKGEKKLSYLLHIDQIEKENLELTEVEHIVSNVKNSRSILKNTFLVPIEDNKKNNKTTIRMLNNNKSIESKDNLKIIQVKSTTTVNQIQENKIADKSVRQPRKQTIKPVERYGSEIIVQPMYYSVNDNNSVEVLAPKKRKYTKLTDEVVKVSDDSDPDYTDRPQYKKRKSVGRKKKYKKIEHITISDSENDSDDDDSVIEILTEENHNTNIENNDLDNQIDDTSVHDLEKSDDLVQIQEVVDNIVQEREERSKNEISRQTEVDCKLSEKSPEEEEEKKDNTKTILKKNNIKCPICPKTFPRDINLKNHMNIHSARRSLRAKNVEKADTKTEPKNTDKESTAELSKKSDKFYCSKCKLKFLSESQLKRHLTIHKETKNVPGLAPKKLQILRKPVSSPLKIRKSINKAIIPDRPKTTLLAKSIDIKNVMMSPRRPFKCDQCPQSFSQRTLLASHKLTHKQFPCTKCNIRFNTNALLNDHLKKKCGKIEVHKTVVRSPLKVKSLLSQVDIRKSVIRSPMKAKNRITQTFHSCTSCRQRFRTLELLKEHEVKEHKKPVTKIVNLKSVATRSKRPHGGVPTSARMQKAFDLMKLKS